jgi:protocatechuate 3,4-dioxygenase beta subunit
MRDGLSRRQILGGFGALLLAGCPKGRVSTPGDARRATPTPTVDDGDDPLPPAAACVLTADNIEGPFFKAGAPNRATLVVAADAGERLALGGVIRGVDCAAIPGAEIELWHANARGDYDLEGFKFRAALQVAADGRWRIDTIVPGRYRNGRRYRPAHVHAKLRAAGHRELTTQLYFDGDPDNDGDPFIVPSLIMPTRVERGVRQAAFDFVLETT